MQKIILAANTGFALYNFRLQLAKFLADRGWEVVAIACDEDDYGKKFKEEGIRFINVFMDHKGTNPLRDIRLCFDLARIYRRESPDIVHHFTIKPVIFGSLAAKIARVPGIVNTITGLGYVFDTGGWLQRMTTRLYSAAFRGKPRVIFQNSDNYQLFLDQHIITPSQSSIILGSGVNTTELAPVDSPSHETPPTFLLIGRMLWSKGVAEFVEAAKIVHQTYPEAKFIMAGGVSGGGAQGNPQAIPQEWLEQVNNEGIVYWEGRVPFSRVSELMDTARVVVLPSYAEGIPKTLIEAASKAKAIITADAPGCRDVVEHGKNGYLVPVRDANSLAERMKEFIANPELAQKMGQEGRKRAVEMFDERIVFEKTLAIYEEVLSGQ